MGWMLDLNILGRYLRAARAVHTRFASGTTMRFKGGPSSRLGKLFGEVDSARTAPAGDRNGREAALRRKGASGQSEHDHRRRRRSARRSVATRAEATTGADRIQRAAEGQTAGYLRRLAAVERVGAAAHQRRRR